jgi:hypothetical protein
MSGVTDQDDFDPVFAMPRDLQVDLGHQGTGRIEDAEIASFRRAAHLLGDAVSAENERGTVGDVIDILDEDCAALLEPIDDEPVMDDLMADINRGAVEIKYALDDLDGAVDTGTESTGVCEQYIHGIRG